MTVIYSSPSKPELLSKDRLQVTLATGYMASACLFLSYLRMSKVLPMPVSTA